MGFSTSSTILRDMEIGKRGLEGKRKESTLGSTSRGLVLNSTPPVIAF